MCIRDRVEGAGPQDEAVGFERDMTEGQLGSDSDAVQVGLRWPIGGEGIVVPVEHDNRADAEDWVHGKSLG